MSSQIDELQDVLTDASRTQFAAVSAAVTFWSVWAESAASYSRGMADELTRLSVGENSSDDALGRMIDLNREYLRQLTELPASAVERFSEEIEKIEKHRRSRPGTAPVRKRRATKAKG